MRDDLNDSISDDEVIEMLAQHLITKPVFDALFAEYSFASNNPVSLGMQNILDLLQEHRLDKEADTLEQFYASVRRRAAGIDKAEGKQKIVVELYDIFFRKAFPKMTERLGIVYTPVEVVDFIIQSVNDILLKEFGQTLGSEGVHILDPFVGTGTFITRLMQSGLITTEQLTHKYKHEIHCNEIVLLAYYIAAINIEAVYHSIIGGQYEPFNGICLTDTFQMYECEDSLEQFFPDNSERRKRQKSLDIRVIVGNPPYSAIQTSENDNNKNIAYPELDQRIRSTYAKHTSAVLKNALYDSYIRAIRWASDRVGTSGVVAFVTNAGFLGTNTGDGMRKCLAEEFDLIYVFHLRGNARTSGEERRKEKDNVFGQGTRTPVAITILVKNPINRESDTAAPILWCDIGDYLSAEQKLATIADYRSIDGIENASKWKKVEPDKYYDWQNQREESFNRFVVLGDKSAGVTAKVFGDYTTGVKSNRDWWCYNYSQRQLQLNMSRMIQFYNSEVKRYTATKKTLPKDKWPDVGTFVNPDPKKISWTREVKQDLQRGNVREFRAENIRQAVYRPYSKCWMYLDRRFNNCVYKMPQCFPTPDAENLLIWVTGIGATVPFACWISDLPCSVQQGPAAAQHFPLFIYDDEIADHSSLFDEEPPASVRRDGITDFALETFRTAYGNISATITKEEIFYYIYGLLHSPDYRNRYKDNLRRELPRIPTVSNYADYKAYSTAGRDLAHLHLQFETVKCYPATIAFSGGPKSLADCEAKQLRVRKMKFAKTMDGNANVDDRTAVIYNEYITVRDIPEEAFKYVVNGKSAIEWVMERQSVTSDDDSGIVNDANLWATETMENAAYPLELLLRVVTVSLETMKIVDSLPALDIE